MVSEMHDPPHWIQQLDFSNAVLRPGATGDAIDVIENRFGIRFPHSYRQFMMFTDGVYISVGRNVVAVYSAQRTYKETLSVEQANSTLLNSDPTFPLFEIGEVEDEDGGVGFMKDELKNGSSSTCPVWCLVNGEVCRTAASFEDFIGDILKIRAGEAYVSTMTDEPDCRQLDPPPPPNSNRSRKWWPFGQRN